MPACGSHSAGGTPRSSALARDGSSGKRRIARAPGSLHTYAAEPRGMRMQESGRTHD
ncbi:hypothetical protein LUTEI9C_30064 [Luteimonas sp. 9C]|nr:hypothetical protein LUTEI9C_30064 [Luteimonas sp. 9C]